MDIYFGLASPILDKFQITVCKRMGQIGRSVNVCGIDSKKEITSGSH